MYLDIYVALLYMDCVIWQIVICSLLVIQIQIGQVALRTGRVLSGVASVWDLLLFPGSAGSRLL
jgi:hypothetical protein